MKALSYLIIALFLIVGGLATTYYVESKTQDSKITLLETQLGAAQSSLKTISDNVAVSDAMLKNLSGNLSLIDEKGYFVSERLSMLERNNAQIRDLLSTALPASGCLLDDTCNAGEVHPSVGGPADQVRKAQGQEVGVRSRPGGKQ